VHHDFWHERWRERRIGFHQMAPHPFLERWWPTVCRATNGRVYVPLCGKSLDMVWLAVRGHRVVGSELSPIAVQEFFGERGTEAGLETRGPFRVHSTEGFDVYEGDAFELTPEMLGPVDAAYDRAALVALPPTLRELYARSFARLLTPGTPALLVAFEYPQELKEGPPFSVTPDEIERLYGEAFVVRELERVNIINESPGFADEGVNALYEVAYSLVRR
jgi:thiopurine S-methyltransferase